MHEILRSDVATGFAPEEVRVVRVGEVPSLRQSSPDLPIVALVRSSSPGEIIAAQLAGADVVLACADGERPAPDDLAAACAAARVMAARAAVQRGETRRAAHEIAGNASAVSMAAQLLAAEVPTKSLQLQTLAEQGAELAWRAGRAARSGRSPLVQLDMVTAVRSLCRNSRPGEVVPTVDAVGCRSIRVLVDRVRFARAITSVLDNARRAGSTSIEVRIRRGSLARNTVELTVTDNGQGLPGDWDEGRALRPFTTGWATPGDGLGLTEAAEFAADHGGTLTVESRACAPGAVVRLQLPDATPHSRGQRAPIASPSSDGDWAVARILEGIARRDPLEQSLQALITAMEQHLPGSTCSILLLDQSAGTLHHGAGERLPAPYRSAIDGVRVGPFAGSCGTAAFTRSEVIAADIGTDERWIDYRAIALPHGLRSCWSTPILDVDRGIVLGTFAVYHAVSWVPDAAATELVQRLTHVAAIAIGTAELHEHLLESEARFRSTFETTGLGIALVNLDGHIQQANAAFSAMAGRAVTGLRLADVVDPGDARAVAAAMSAMSDRQSGPGVLGDRLPSAEVRVWVAGQEEPLWAALSGSLIRGRDGDPRHFCVELFDLTERRRVAQAYQDRAIAEAANHAKSELLALVSHELRTPLNAVIGFAQLLDANRLTKQQERDGVGHILSAGRHLLRLINDLIDLTGAESGQLRLTPEPVALSHAVREALEIVAGLADERSVKLSGPDDVPEEWVEADPQRLRQVLLNLIGNGIKFTPAGGRVTIGLERGAIVVTDTGPGIDPEQLEQLFLPFHRASETGAEGSGLGLALSQRLTAAMGGHLTVASELGVGSTFRVELAACAPKHANPAQTRDAVSDHEPRGRVLYLEDDPASRLLLSSALSRWPTVTLDLAATCAEARSLLAKSPADLLLIDIGLPDGNGWEFVQELAAHTNGYLPPTLVVTAGPRTAPPALADVEVFGKPWVVNEILGAISRRLTSSAPR
ncbi:ATP-binding protein [Amycolatopsis cynarae]|uniref:histidine kinase n=1 Tax=Amycolatopsis cynarae TaxID=2995223 RepID=A0ABY7B5Z5_9PSEU|nr:ATP-binding protein [Amycolatopsis sp. HUAS 11-8]WAL67744.1 ATP-binding protein [Amycolatopsis sp. HUAS 11-8]